MRYGLRTWFGLRRRTSNGTAPEPTPIDAPLRRALTESEERCRTLEGALRESEDRYALAASGVNDGLWDWDLRATRIHLSERWKGILGHSKEGIGSDPQEWLGRIHPDDATAVRQGVDEHLAGRTPHFESEHRILHKDGTYRWVLCRGVAMKDEAGKRIRMAGSLTDLTGMRLFDVLTGLPNRTLLGDRLAGALERAKAEPGLAFALLYLDLDRFKVVNESLGRASGDRILSDIARRLQACLGPRDTLARPGADEFAILLEGIRDVSDAVRTAEVIQREIMLPFVVNGQEVFSGASIGIVLSLSGYEQAEDMIRDAESAMSRARARGGGRHEVFDPYMRTRAVTRLRLETDLRRALEREELRVFYQPIVSLETAELRGFEALVRWQHPERGLLAPASFIGLAEETGMIDALTRWVLEEACRQMRVWDKRFGERPAPEISVNLSAKNLLRGDLPELVENTLMEAGLEPGRLTLEITESVLMSDPERSHRILSQLERRDIRACIDDFGTGYSSLSYLHRLPIDTLKIDRSFVSDLGVDEKASEIIRSIMMLAHRLGWKVVAEGVSTRDQLIQLLALGCPYAQGFLFSHPVDADRITEVLAQGPTWKNFLTTEAAQAATGRGSRTQRIALRWGS